MDSINRRSHGPLETLWWSSWRTTAHAGGVSVRPEANYIVDVEAIFDVVSVFSDSFIISSQSVVNQVVN